MMGKANGAKKKTRKSKKAIVKDEGQNNTDAQLTSNGTEGNVIVDKLIKDEVQSVGRTKITTRSMKKLTEGNATVEKPKGKDGQQIFCQTKEDMGSSGNLAEVSVAVMNPESNPELLDELQSTDQRNIDAGSTKSLAEGTVGGKRRSKRERTARAETEAEVKRELDARNLAEEKLTTKKSKIEGAVQNTGPTKMDIGNLKIQDETQSMCHTNLDDGQTKSVITKRKTKKKANVTNGKPNVKDEPQSLGKTQMNTGSTENLADGKVITENPKDEAQGMNQNSTDTGQLAESLAQEDVAGKRLKKRKNKKKVKVNNEFHSKMDTKPEYLAEGVATLNEPEIRDAVESVAQTEMDTGSKDNDTERDVTIHNTKVQDEIHSTVQAKMDPGPTGNLAEGNMIVKKKKKQRKTKKAEVKDDFSGRMEAGSTEVLAEVNLNNRILETRDEAPSMGLTQMDPRSTRHVAEGNVNVENSKVQDGTKSIDQEKMDTGPTQNLAEGNVTAKRKKRRKRTKVAKVEDEFSIRMDTGATENIARVGSTQMDTRLSHNVAEVNAIVENSKVQDEIQRIDQTKVDTVPSYATVKRRRRRQRKKAANVKDEFSGRMDAGSTKDLDEGIGHAEGRSAIPTCNAVTVKDAEISCLKTAPVVSVGKKLLVLDINGLLADVVFPAPKNYKADTKFFGRAVFRRPFCADFLKFCFQNFNVGIWSSRTRKVIDKVLSFILDDQKDNLLFVWDMKHCTKTGFKTLENRHKPLVCKELRKIWENDDPSCPWKKGDFNESNTLLIDDSPYKALLNPLHTAISPHPYQYTNDNDNSLGPGGDLRVYLEGVAASENVQKYVEQHPFGQSQIGEQDLSWEFYNLVLKQMSNVTTSQPMVS